MESRLALIGVQNNPQRNINKRVKFDTFYEEIIGGLSKGKTLEDLCKKHNTSLEELTAELHKGIKVEKEHTDSDSMAKEIAMDHLTEDPKYYTKIAKAGL